MRTLLIAILISGTLTDAQTKSLKWSQANPSGATPSPRIDAPIAYDPVGRQILMFAGQDASGDLNDVWAYAVTSNSGHGSTRRDRLLTRVMDTRSPLTQCAAESS